MTPRPSPHGPAPRPPHPAPGYSHTPAARSFSCTVFTFGQTGSGKTYTLTGPPSQVGRSHSETPGGGARGVRGRWARSPGEPQAAQTPRGKGRGR